MKVDGKPTRTIWLEADGWSVGIIDQTALPHRFATLRLTTLDDAAHAIKSMQVRGAPLIGAAAAYGMCLALRADASDEAHRARLCGAARDAADRDQSEMGARRDDGRGPQPAARGARRRGLPPRRRDRDEDVAINQAIGRHGLKLIEDDRRAQEAGEPVNVLTHCNAGWLATVDCRHRDRADLHGARQGHRRSMSGSTRRGRATRAPRSPPGSSASTACRTP